MAIQALADGRGVALSGGVVRALAVIVALAVSGCFYVDPINQRPSIDIRQASSEEVYRGSNVELQAVVNDPEGQFVLFGWRAYVCDDANDQTTCDETPFFTSELERVYIDVPTTRVDAAVPVQSVLVILQARDDHGAVARPDSRLIIPVGNQPPTVSVSVDFQADGVVGTDVHLYALVTDPDDAAAALGVEWKLYSPTNQLFTLVDDPSAPPGQLGKLFHAGADAVGQWELEVTVTDTLGASATTNKQFAIKPDSDPCIDQFSPIAAPVGEVLLVSDPTLFQVTHVADDLDAYPGRGYEPFGTTQFAWSIKQPGSSTFASLPVTTNNVPLDPNSYTPGDVVELRVEIADRKATPLMCAENQPTCSTTSSATCIQRLTWRVEVR